MNTYQFDKLAIAEIGEDAEGCTVLYPPLGWPKGARVLLTLEDEPRYTVTPAGKAALRGGGNG